MEYQVLDKEKDRMARKKKNDFWDDVEDLNTVSEMIRPEMMIQKKLLWMKNGQL